MFISHRASEMILVRNPARQRVSPVLQIELLHELSPKSISKSTLCLRLTYSILSSKIDFQVLFYSISDLALRAPSSAIHFHAYPV